MEMLLEEIEFQKEIKKGNHFQTTLLKKILQIYKPDSVFHKDLINMKWLSFILLLHYCNNLAAYPFPLLMQMNLH